MGRSFFCRLSRGDFTLGDRDDLWALLVTITLNKVRNAADHHFAAKRDVRRTRPLPSFDESWTNTPHDPIALEFPEPSPADAAALTEALEIRLRDLPEPDLRQVALMKLEGFTTCEIADRIKCSKRTVERKLGLIRKRWESTVEDLT
jgi:DNA-directed RNA polymerase specialized sigma24 family protein